MTEFIRYKELLKAVHGNKSERKKKQVEQLIRDIHQEINDKISEPQSFWSFFSRRPTQVPVRQQDIMSLNKHGLWQDYLQRLSERIKDKLTVQQVRHIAQRHLRNANASLKKQLKEMEHVAKRFSSSSKQQSIVKK